MGYKHDYDKILTRLVSILSMLNDGKLLTKSELANEFGVSERTISRDFDRLSFFPIYKDGKYWKMQDGFRIEKGVSLQEKITLDILESMARGAGDKFFQSATKILDRLKNQSPNPIYAKLHLEDISSHIHDISILESAIDNKKIITCRYNKHDMLKLQPQKITNYEGFWYLVAIDMKDSKLKKYYLKDMKNTKLTDENFTPRSKIQKLLDESISIWFDENTEPFEVRLFVDSKVVKYFERKPLSSTQSIVSKDKDGSIEISLMITHEMEILPIVKYWIPHIKVLSPDSLALQVRDEVEEYLREVVMANVL